MTDRTSGGSAPEPPRHGAARAPLLAVIGGPTGAGKSTLLNSLVRAPVSAAGVLRPTTRRPVLVCNPSDWASVRRHGLRPICAPLMPAGIAVIDAPDIDSIEPSNRALADELFAEADLWLFVTTASRYADAANWRHLRAARARRVALAIVLDRVSAGHAPDIIGHMRDLLGPPEPPLFVIPEARLDRQGMLPDSITAPLRGWLADVVEAARTGPPQPAIGKAAVPAGSLVSADAGSADAGLTLEFELTPAADRAVADGDDVPHSIAYGEGLPDSDADGDGVPDSEFSRAGSLAPEDLTAEDLADAAMSDAEESGTHTDRDSGSADRDGPSGSADLDAEPAGGEPTGHDGAAEAGESQDTRSDEPRARTSPPADGDDAAALEWPPPFAGTTPAGEDGRPPIERSDTDGADETSTADGPAYRADAYGDDPAVIEYGAAPAEASASDGHRGAVPGSFDVVESSPESSDQPDGRPDRPTADIPKAADVGETVKL